MQTGQSIDGDDSLTGVVLQTAVESALVSMCTVVVIAVYP